MFLIFIFILNLYLYLFVFVFVCVLEYPLFIVLYVMIQFVPCFESLLI